MPSEIKTAARQRRYKRTLECLTKYKDKIPEFIYDNLITPKENASNEETYTLIYKMQQIDEQSGKSQRNVINEIFMPETVELKSKGFAVWRLQKTIAERDAMELLEAFDGFYDGVVKLKQLKDRLEALDIDREHPQFLELIHKIKRKDVYNLEAIAEEITDLDEMIKSGDIYILYSDKKARDEWGNPVREDHKPISDMAKQMFMKKIKEDFSSKGFVTKKLEKVLEGDIRNVGRAFWVFEQMLSKLDRVDSRLKRHARNMDPAEVKKIESFLKDPDNYYKGITMIGELEARIDPTGDATLMAYYKRTIDNYKKLNLVTVELEKIIKRPLGEAAKLFETYDENYRKFLRIRVYLDRRRAFFKEKDKIDSIEKKLLNPLLRSELENEIRTYEKEASDFIEKCEERIIIFEELGFEVPYLYEAIEDFNMSMDEIVSVFKIYYARIKKLIYFRDASIPRLRSFNNPEIEFGIESISEIISAPEKFVHMVELMIKTEEMARPNDPGNYLSKLKAKIEFLKQKGINSDPLMRLTNFNIFNCSDFVNAMELIELKKDTKDLLMYLKLEKMSRVPDEIKPITETGAASLLAEYNKAQSQVKK